MSLVCNKNNRLMSFVVGSITADANESYAYTNSSVFFLSHETNVFIAHCLTRINTIFALFFLLHCLFGGLCLLNGNGDTHKVLMHCWPLVV